LFVTDAVQQPNFADFEFVKAAMSQGLMVIIAVTMFYSTDYTDRAIQKIGARVAAFFGAGPDKPIVVGVTPAWKSAAIERNDPRLLAASGFPELEAAIQYQIESAIRIRIEAVSKVVQEVAARLRQPIMGHLAAIRSDSVGVDEELRIRRERYRELELASPRWRRDLRRDMNRAARAVQERLNEDLDGIGDQLRRVLESREPPRKREAFSEQISQAVSEAANRAIRSLEGEANQVASAYAAMTRLPINWPSDGIQLALPAFDPLIRENLAGSAALGGWKLGNGPFSRAVALVGAFAMAAMLEQAKKRQRQETLTQFSEIRQRLSGIISKQARDCEAMCLPASP